MLTYADQSTKCFFYLKDMETAQSDICCLFFVTYDVLKGMRKANASIKAWTHGFIKTWRSDYCNAPTEVIKRKTDVKIFWPFVYNLHLLFSSMPERRKGLLDGKPDKNTVFNLSHIRCYTVRHCLWSEAKVVLCGNLIQLKSALSGSCGWITVGNKI